jgi:hydroxylysine kinase
MAQNSLKARSTFSAMAGTAPRWSAPVMPRDIERWCDVHFGVLGSAETLTGEIDLNFRLTTSGGERFVAKLSHAQEDRTVLDFQCAALRHVERSAPDLPVPRVIATRAGGFIADVLTAANDHRMLRLLNWQDGQPMHQVPLTDGSRRSVGRLAARLAMALADFSHPASNRVLIWDMKRAAGLHDLMESLASEDKALVRPVYSRFVDGFSPRIPEFRAQVVHNDLNLYNLLVDPADHSRVTGCLDFGDLVHTPLIIDLAVAAAYQADTSADVVGSIITMAEAYHQALPLTPVEMDWLVDLVAMRAAMTLIIARWRVRQQPDNAPYLLRNEPAAKALLLALADVPKAELRTRVRDALLGSSV